MYGGKVNTNFEGKKVPKENALYKCLLSIMLDFVIIHKHFWKSVNM